MDSKAEAEDSPGVPQHAGEEVLSLRLQGKGKEVLTQLFKKLYVFSLELEKLTCDSSQEKRLDVRGLCLELILSGFTRVKSSLE